MLTILPQSFTLIDVAGFNPLSANPTKWSNILKQLSVFDHFVILALKGLSCVP